VASVLVAALLEMPLAFLRCSLLRCPPRFGVVALAVAFNPGHPLILERFFISHRNTRFFAAAARPVQCQDVADGISAKTSLTGCSSFAGMPWKEHRIMSSKMRS
jgi:hypothetical protein